MGSELDYDDLFAEPVITNARAGRFQPKVKPRPKKKPAGPTSSAPANDRKENPIRAASTSDKMTLPVQSVDAADDRLTKQVDSTTLSSTPLENNEPLKNFEDSSLEVPHTDDTKISESENSTSHLVGAGEAVNFTNVLPLEVAMSDSNENLCCSTGDLADKSDSFGKDTESFDKIHPEHATSIDNTLTDPDNSLLYASEMVCSDFPLDTNEGSGPNNNRRPQLADSISQLGPMRQDVVSTNDLNLEITNSEVMANWDCNVGGSAGKENSMEFILDPFSDILPEPATSTFRTGRKFQLKVKPNSRKKTSALGTSVLHKVTKENIIIDPMDTCKGSQSDDNTNLALANPSPEIATTNTLHPVFESSDGIENWDSISLRKLTGEYADILYCEDLHSQPMTSTSSAPSETQQTVTKSSLPGNTFPNSHHIGIDDDGGNLGPSPSSNLYGSRMDEEPDDMEFEEVSHCEIEYSNHGSISPIPSVDVLDYPANIDPTCSVESLSLETTSYGDGVHLETGCGRSAKVIENNMKRKAPHEIEGIELSGSSRRLRARIPDFSHNEAEDGTYDGGFPSEPYNNLDDDINNEECRVDNAPVKKRARRRSKKADPDPENEKPVQKRKKANGIQDKLVKEPPKKFSHSTRRNKRQVDKVLLETPYYEIDTQKVPIKQLILLAEIRERSEIKEASTSKIASTNPSINNSSPRDAYNEVEAYDRDPDDCQTGSPPLQVHNGYFNYHSFMDRTPSTRWSKQDTELFYEAIRQFGTDFSMIQQLFPDRTRNQIKLKYKKEERQHPLRLSEAVQNRAKNHSHFELVIEKLQQAAQTEMGQDISIDEIHWSGEEDEVAEAPFDTHNEEQVAKSVQNGREGKKEEEEVEADDTTRARSLENFDENDDDADMWNLYKSSY